MDGRWGGGSCCRPRSGGCGACGVAVTQEAGSRGSGVGVLLVEGGLGVLRVGGAVVQVRAAADRGGELSGEHQAGLHERLRVDVRLGQPGDRNKE